MKKSRFWRVFRALVTAGLILAGILTTEYSTVRDAFAALGCVELGNSTEREWTGGSFRVPAAS